MKQLVETIKSLNFIMDFMLTCALLATVPLGYGENNCPPGKTVSVSVSGPSAVEAGQDAEYSCTLNSGDSGGNYNWTYTGFTGPSSGSPVTLTAQSNPSTAIGDKTVTCIYTDLSGECSGSDSINVTIVKIEVLPSSMTATESMDSGDFSCKVTPAGLSPIYNWLSGSVNGAWPSGSGNSPQLQYSSPTAKITKVQTTRWFAPNNSNDILRDGGECDYGVGVEATIGGIKFKKQSASTLTVTVDATGECDKPEMVDSGTIQLTDNNGIWYVSGKGNFRKTAPIPWVSVPTSSQFYAKLMTHENTHNDQFLNQTPWKDLYDADGLYNSTIVNMTHSDENLLRGTILFTVMTKRNSDDVILQQNMLSAERAAFSAQNGAAPNFLEYVNEADWRAEYSL